MTSESEVIGEITIMQQTEQDKSVLDALMLHNSSHLFSVSCCHIVKLAWNNAMAYGVLYDLPMKMSQVETWPPVWAPGIRARRPGGSLVYHITCTRLCSVGYRRQSGLAAIQVASYCGTYGDLLHTEMVYPPTDGHPSKY